MDNFNLDRSNSEEKEEDEIYKKTSPNDSNSILLEENDYSSEDNYENQYTHSGINKICYYNFNNSKPKNIIDYFNFNSEEYKKYKIYQRVKMILSKLNGFHNSYIEEICYLSWYYLKKLSHKKLSTIVPIITYKIILKYNIKSITLKDLKNNINFKCKKYFKNEKLFTELNSVLNQKEKIYENIYSTKSTENNLNNSHDKKIYNIKTQKYSDLVYNSVKNSINKIKEKSQYDLNIIKMRGKKIIQKNGNNKIGVENKNKDNVIIEKMIEQLSNEDKNINEMYCSPFNYELNNCLEQCMIFIYNKKQISSDDNNITQLNNKVINIKEEEKEKIIFNEDKFNKYFENKICSDILGLGLIKYFIDKNKILILSFNSLKKIFNCNIYQVKKSIFLIKLYNKYISNI